MDFIILFLKYITVVFVCSWGCREEKWSPHTAWHGQSWTGPIILHTFPMPIFLLFFPVFSLLIIYLPLYHSLLKITMLTIMQRQTNKEEPFVNSSIVQATVHFLVGLSCTLHCLSSFLVCTQYLEANLAMVTPQGFCNQSLQQIGSAQAGSTLYLSGSSISQTLNLLYDISHFSGMTMRK